MGRYDAAERIACAIHANGRGCLSDSEEDALKDSQFMAIVKEILHKLQRADILTRGPNDSRRTTPIEIFDSAAKCFHSAQWKNKDAIRRAELWVNYNHGNAVLDIKEWSEEEYYGAIDIGAHELIYRRRIKYDNISNTREEVANILKQHGCPEQVIHEFVEELT